MNKLKSGLLFFSAVFLFGSLKAQTLEEGKKFLYYERHTSARNVFEKLVAANPNNLEAVYWLGQAMIVSDDKPDLPGAIALYRKTLMNNPNSPLLLAGMGHTQLMEGKTAEARQAFETAFTLSQGKNVAVLNAIGFANVNADKGDADYAIEKLKLATTIKNMKDPDVWANLGDAYKKLLQGGPAQSAYESALEIDPKYARASFRIGKIYQTQGRQQEEIYMRYYNDAIAKDPAYAPVYENLYQYYYLTDVNKSAEYLDKYLANADNDPKDCYYRASMKYAQGNFAESITSADECLKGESPYPNLYGLKAYAYDRMGDSLNAKAQFETYFQKQKPEKIGPTDELTYGKVLLKFPGSDSLAGLSIDKAVALDSTDKGKAEALKVMTAYYEGQKNFIKAGDWYSKINSVKTDVRKTDLYNAGYSYFRGGAYVSSINVFNIYAQKFPDDAFGYYMAGKANWAIDSTLEQGLANASFEKAIEVGLKDTVKYKNQLIGSYKYFIVYSVYKKDKAAALAYCDKVLALDPADAETATNKTTITAMNMNAPAPKQPKANPTGTKPSGGGTKGMAPKLP